ncbi:MAG: hypothetical protein K2F90_05275 [Clostridiales bacterium]|nr:hypothetical protein [Clostridiales bacterium]
MNNDVTITAPEESVAITEKDFQQFLTATGDEQWKILLSHAERNKKIIQIRRLKTMNEQYNDHHYEEISKQFEEFCHTKGIAAKFKVAFAQMAENTRKQKEADKAQLEEVKRQSAENNPEFTEFLHTKGFKAKVKLIIENIKNGAKESNERVRKQIEQAKHGVPAARTSAATYSAEELSHEFNAFLKSKGLDGKYVVKVSDSAE